MFLPIQGHVDGLYTDRELEHIRALYAEKVTMVDKWFGHLMNNIRTLGMEDDTPVSYTHLDVYKRQEEQLARRITAEKD